MKLKVSEGKIFLEYAWPPPPCSSGNPLQFAVLQAVRRQWARASILQWSRWHPGRAGTWPVSPEELMLFLDVEPDLSAPSLPIHPPNYLPRPPAVDWGGDQSLLQRMFLITRVCISSWLQAKSTLSVLLSRLSFSSSVHDLALVSLWMSLSIHSPPSGPSLQPRLGSYFGFGYTDYILASGIFSYLSQLLNLF